MKWITPLWSNPVGWSEWVAKTKTRVFLCVIVHICFVAGGLFMIYWSLQILRDLDSPSLRFYAVLAGAGPIVFIGVAYPAMYLYAMYRLLAMLRARDNSPKDKTDG